MELDDSLSAGAELAKLHTDLKHEHHTSTDRHIFLRLLLVHEC